MNPTEDTPTPTNKDDKLDNSNPPAQKLDRSGQDDKQLREAIETQVMAYCVIKGGNPNAKTLGAYMTIDNILALFQKEQLQLVSELEGELPKKHDFTIVSHDEIEKADWRGYNSAVDLARAVLEHKKQELEGEK